MDFSREHYVKCFGFCLLLGIARILFGKLISDWCQSGASIGLWPELEQSDYKKF